MRKTEVIESNGVSNQEDKNKIIPLTDLDKQHTLRLRNLTAVVMQEGERAFDATDELTKQRSRVEYTKVNCLKVAGYGTMNGKKGWTAIEIPILDLRRIIDFVLTEPHRSYIQEMVKVEVARNTGFEDLPEVAKKE